MQQDCCGGGVGRWQVAGSRHVTFLLWFLGKRQLLTSATTFHFYIPLDWSLVLRLACGSKPSTFPQAVMEDAMDLDGPAPRGTKRTADEAGLPSEAPRRIKACLLLR